MARGFESTVDGSADIFPLRAYFLIRIWRSFFGPDLKVLKRAWAESLCQRNVGSIAAPCDQDSGCAPGIVPWVENPPRTAEIDLHPGSEIPWRMGFRLADIAEISGAIPRGNVHASAKGDRKMGKIATHALAFIQRCVGCARRTRFHIVEGDVSVHEVANRLYPRPSRFRVLEKTPGFVRKQIRIAVAAAKKIDQRFERQILNGMRDGAR